MERIAPFTLAHPATLAEAAALLIAKPGARLLAGGTDLLPNLRDGLGKPRNLIDLGGIAGFDRIAVTEHGITIGAGVTLARLAVDARIRHTLPALAEAASAVAAPAHRSVATVGGNLCVDTRCVFYNQSEWWRRSNDYCLKHGGETCHVAPQGDHCHAAFAGDLAPALLVQDAEIDVVGSQRTRRIPLAALYADDGAKHLTLAPGEIVAAVHVPPQPPHARAGYRKARVRGAIDFPLAGVAARVVLRDGSLTGLSIALTGTNSRPLLLEGTAELAGHPLDDELLGRIGKLVSKQASPMRTTVTHANYRRQVAVVLAQRLVRALAESGDPERTC
jgi:4-hydroxybenzoyl-CoA reductase subunit beta